MRNDHHLSFVKSYIGNCLRDIHWLLVSPLTPGPMHFVESVNSDMLIRDGIE